MERERDLYFVGNKNAIAPNIGRRHLWMLYLCLAIVAVLGLAALGLFAIYRHHRKGVEYRDRTVAELRKARGW